MDKTDVLIFCVIGSPHYKMFGKILVDNIKTIDKKYRVKIIKKEKDAIDRQLRSMNIKILPSIYIGGKIFEGTEQCIYILKKMSIGDMEDMETYESYLERDLRRFKEQGEEDEDENEFGKNIQSRLSDFEKRRNQSNQEFKKKLGFPKHIHEEEIYERAQKMKGEPETEKIDINEYELEDFFAQAIKGRDF